MGEGVTLKNVTLFICLNAFYNIPEIEQVIGRAIKLECVFTKILYVIKTNVLL